MIFFLCSVLPLGLLWFWFYNTQKIEVFYLFVSSLIVLFVLLIGWPCADLFLHLFNYSFFYSLIILLVDSSAHSFASCLSVCSFVIYLIINFE